MRFGEGIFVLKQAQFEVYRTAQVVRQFGTRCYSDSSLKLFDLLLIFIIM